MAIELSGDKIVSRNAQWLSSPRGNQIAFCLVETGGDLIVEGLITVKDARNIAEALLAAANEAEKFGKKGLN